MERARTGTGSGSWKTIVTPPMTGAANMAFDHALMERARRTGEQVLRVYSWSVPTLSLGRHQVARNRIDPDVARAAGVALVRRPTGGRALLHHHEVTYSITAALSRDDSVRDWYTSINSVLLCALRALGVDAHAARSEDRTPVPATASCFARPDEGEIVVDGRKLVGSALLRQQNALLQHGSILIDDDQPLLNAVLPAGELRPAPAGTLRQVLAVVPSVADIAQALRSGLQLMLGEPSTELTVDSHLSDEAADLERVYASDDWTFRY
jgi:lipoate-protein ligase A